MKKLFLFITLIATCIAINAQNSKFSDKKVAKLLREAEVNLPDFHCDSIIKVYPIYYLLTKKEYRNKKFRSIPTYNEIDSCMNFEKTKIDEVLVKTTNGIWRITGWDSERKVFCHNKNFARNIVLFNYLDKIKADKLYYIFGQSGYYLMEKDGKRTPIKETENTWQECELADLFPDYSVEDFNIFIFPYNAKRMAPVLGY